MFFCHTYSDCLKAEKKTVQFLLKDLRMCNELWSVANSSLCIDWNKNITDCCTQHLTILNLRCTYLRILLISKWFLEFCFFMKTANLYSTLIYTGGFCQNH